MCKKDLLIQSVILISVMLLLASCGQEQIPGIDTPVSVDDIQLQLVSVTTQESYSMTGGQTVKASSADEILLIVEAEVVSGDFDHESFSEWEVSVQDENGREDVPGIKQSGIMGETQEAKWIFSVDQSSESFTLSLPGGHMIELDSLVQK